MSKKSYSMDMCNGPILGKMLRFALPLMCSSMLQILFNAADIIVVGKFGAEHSIAAVGSNSSLINLMTNLFIGLSVGANVLVARYFGAKRGKDIKETVHTSMTLSLLSGIAIAIIGIILAPILLELMNTPDEIIHSATTYLRIYFLGMPAMMIYNFGNAILRAVGDTKRPLYFLFGAGLINVLLNLLFVIVFKWDVVGVAASTVISQCISALLIVICLLKEQGDFRLEFKSLRIHKDKLKDILKIGLPAGLQGTIFSLSNVVIQSSVNLFGASVVDGNSAAQNIESVVYFAMNAFHHATLSFTSQNIGAGKRKRVGKILRTGLLCAITAGILTGGLVVLFSEELLSIYIKDEAAIKAGVIRLNFICGTYALCGIMDVMVGSIRGMGYAVMPMIVSLIGACGLRLIWIATVFQIPKYHVIETIYTSYPVTWTITFIAHVICYIIIQRRFRKKSTNERFF